MKFRLGLILCGIVLIAAVPAWADKAPGDAGKEFGNRESSQETWSGSSFWKTFWTSAFNGHPDGGSGADSFGIGAGPKSNWVAARERHFVEGLPTTPPAMPEPASLPLIVFGLVGLGFYARRR